MAILKQRLHRKNASGTYDTVHLETSADLVLMSDGTTNLSDKLSSMDTTIAGKAAASHGTHVTFSTTTPKAAGTASVGTATTVSRSDHVHPAQTTVTGNAGTATKLATSRTIRTNLSSTSSVNFDGSANITPGVTGTLPIANGGTGVTSLDDLKTSLGISKSQGTGTSYDIANAGIGNFVKWANKMWIIVHAESDRIYLAAAFIYSETTFGSSATYKNSTLATVAKNYENTIPTDSLALTVSTTVNSVTSKIFVPSYEQLTSGFVYFYSNSQREFDRTTYWSSSKCDNPTIVNPSGNVWYVYDDGALAGNMGVTSTLGFRPFVALKR